MFNRIAGLAGMVAVALLALAGDASAQMLDKKALSIAEAKKIAAAAMDEANKNNWTVVVSVIDDGGNLMYLERKDGTQLASSDIAVGKARAALYFKRPSKALEDTINGGASPARFSVMTLNQGAPFARPTWSAAGDLTPSARHRRRFPVRNNPSSPMA